MKRWGLRLLAVACGFALLVGIDALMKQPLQAQYEVTMVCYYKPSGAVGTITGNGVDGATSAGGWRLDFSYTGHRDGADCYHLQWTSPDGEVSSQDIRFRGQRLVVYEDDSVLIAAVPQR